MSQIVKIMLFVTFLSIGNRKIGLLTAKANKQDLESIIGLIADSKVKPLIERHYPLRDIAEAVRYLSNGHALDKVIVDVAADPVVK